MLEELGKGLMPEPLLSSVLLGGAAVGRGGSETQRQSVLPPLIAGDLLLALAYQERQSRYELDHVATRAERAGDGWRLSGEKCMVLDGHIADRLVVSARTGGGARDRDGVTLFLLDAHAPGITVTRQWTRRQPQRRARPLRRRRRPPRRTCSAPSAAAPRCSAR